jgi:prepilin-type N-terminal cleavage/methylation domain-containing protein
VRSPQQRGFTIIELLVVVAIVAILASVAVFMFSKTANEAQVKSEVPAMITEFKLKQERYYVENNSYVSGAEGTMFPATPAGTDQANSIASPPTEWTDLRLDPGKAALWCSYVTVAGPAGNGSNIGTIANSFGLTAAPTTDWFYVIAECDTDGKGAPNARYFATHDSNEIFEQNVGR